MKHIIAVEEMLSNLIFIKANNWKVPSCITSKVILLIDVVN
jgi:hypothetical protein